MAFSTQIIWLFILAIPVARVAWTVTHEQVLGNLEIIVVKEAGTAITY